MLKMLKETLQKDMVAAMKAGEKLKLGTLRSVLGAVTDAETSGKARKDLSDSEIIAVLKKLVKTRRESATIYADAGSVDRADTENAEADIIEAYLPQQLSEEETTELIRSIISENNLADAGPRGIGMVMKVLKSRDDVDAAMASKIARAELS